MQSVILPIVTLLDSVSQNLFITESLYFLTTFAYFTPFPPPPLAITELFFVFLIMWSFFFSFFDSHISEIIQYFYSLTYFSSIMPLRFIYIVANGKLSLFLWLNNIPLYIYIYHIFSTHASISRHLGCLHALVIISNVAINMGLQIFEFLFLFPSNRNPEGEFLDLRVILVLIFLRNNHSVFQWLHQFTFPPTGY